MIISEPIREYNIAYTDDEIEILKKVSAIFDNTLAEMEDRKCPNLECYENNGDSQYYSYEDIQEIATFLDRFIYHSPNKMY